MTATSRHEQLGDPQPAEPLHPDEVMELTDLLRLVEDWLLHAGWDVHDSLTRFAHFDLTRDPAARVDELIDALGSYAIRLRTVPIEPTR